MKKDKIVSKILILFIILTPVFIYVFSDNIDNNSFKFIDDTLIKYGLKETTKETTSIKEITAKHYKPTTGGEYVYGEFERLISDWTLPYTITQEQYGNDPEKVGFCCARGWPTVKTATPSYMNDIDEAGTDHAYPSWAKYSDRLALANRDGHRERVECEIENEFINLSKAIAYAKSGLNGAYNNSDLQNLVWASNVWDGYADSILEIYAHKATEIDTIGGVTTDHWGSASRARLVRAQQFATWAYQVLGSDGILDLKMTPSKGTENEVDGSKELHVEVDQSNFSYLVGPYRIDLANGGDVINGNITANGTGKQTLGDFVYKEMTMQNYAETQANIFIKTHFFIHATYTDNSHDDIEVARNGEAIAKQTSISNRIVITDENGAALEYGIPRFGESFYIRYYCTKDQAINKTLKYLQPEMKTEYINNAMSAGGTKAHSKHVLYSVHYSLCNRENDAVNSYVKNKGYDNIHLGNGENSGSLYSAFFYSSKQSKVANLQEGIDALVEMVANSNQGGTAKVTWYDDTMGGWDGFEQYYGDERDRCDGVFLDDTDCSFSGGDNPYFFACEFDTVDEFYRFCTLNYMMDATLRTNDHNGYVNGIIEHHTHNMLTVNSNKCTEFDTSMYGNFNNYVETNCGCKNLNCYCPCKCSGDKDCDCDEDDDPTDDEVPTCTCGGCNCKYGYKKCTLTMHEVHFCRDKRGEADTEVVKNIWVDDNYTNKITINASQKKYNSAAAAVRALNNEVNRKIEEYYNKAVRQFQTWYYQHAYPALYVPFSFEDYPYSLPFVEEAQTRMQKVIFNLHLINSSSWNITNISLTKKEINEYLGGNISENELSIESREGIQIDDIWQGSGIEVSLIDLGVHGSHARPTPPTPPTPVTEVAAPLEPVEPTMPVEPVQKLDENGQLNLTDEEYKIAHDQWVIDYNQYITVDKPNYDNKLEEYNRLLDIYNQYLIDYANYQSALIQYNKELTQYNQDLANWEANAGLPNINKVVKVTLTDENGNYGFQRLNPLHTYMLQFRYDGLEFIDDLGNPTSMDSTTEISDTIKNRNTAAEIDYYNQNLSNDPRDIVQGRSQVNYLFEKIDASNVNYTGNYGRNKAYGWYTKLRGNNTKFIAYNNPELEPNGGLDNNVGAMRFVDAYYLFKKNAIDNAPKIKQGNIGEIVGSYVDIESGRTITYDKIIKDNLPGILASKGVSTGINENNIEHGGMNEYDETKQVSNFIYDSLVVAETKIHFPDNEPVKYFLEDVGTGNTTDSNNKKVNNTDRHNNYHHDVCDNPFPVNRGSGKRRVNSLYNNERTNNGSTINNRDQARNIDLRIKRREEANLLIAMDLTQVTLTINGQKEIYKYGDLDLNEGNVAQLAKVSARAGQELQNYNQSYSRIITESMFLYKGSLVDEGSGDSRDLSMYITYKIIIKNSGKVNLDVGYIVDHYDAYYLQWKSEDQAKIKTIVGDENCTAEVTPNDDGNHTGGSHPYNSDKKQLAAGGIGNMYNEVFIKVGKLAPEETKAMTITFEQQKDPTYKRLKINQDIETGALLIGDKNVVEIDGYTSSENDIFQRGLITRHSNIGNLCPVDFYDNGNKTGGLIDDKTNPVENRVEIDTAAGPNLVIYIPTDGYIPCISGYTYEDVRNNPVENAVIGNGKYDDENDKDYRKNDDNSDDLDKKIRGVTVQLVELVKEVDAYGLSSSDTANYIKEKIWGTTTFTLDAYMGTDNRRGTDSVIYVPNTTPLDKDVHRYSSGKDKAQVILNVNSGYLNVENKKDENGNSYVALSPEEGMYRFVNVPPGVFVVRFIYGDTTQTMLVKNNGTGFGNEVNELIANKGPAPMAEEDSVINYEDSKHDQYMFLKGDSDGYISKEGLNQKSYNGNDYKSTIYQAELEQEESYKGVNAYTDYEKQNFSNDNGYEMTQVTDGDILDKLYYYNITKADSHSDKTISDAKDIYSFRQNSDNYAKGYISTLSGNLKSDHDIAQKQALEDNRANGENPITLRNYRNEIMNSFEQIGTYTSRNVKPESVADNENYFDANRQVEMLKELMKYTRMVAQTGIINFEVEYTVNDWGSAHGSDKEYVPVDKLNNGTPEDNNLPSNNFLQNERTKRYHIRDLNLGLVERPEAQIRLNKIAANVKITLSNGETLFDTNKSVNNMFYAKHKAHTYNFSKSFRLQSTKVSMNSLATPELIQTYMDDELIENATLEVKYVSTVENVGEVDYLDKQFYYTGKEEHANDLTNISRTNIDEVLDYVPNKITFNAAASNELDELRVKQSSDKTKLNSGYEKSFWQVKSIIPSENNGIIDSKEYYKTYIYPFGVSTIDAQRDQTPINEAALSVDQLTGEYLYGLGGNATTGAAAGNLNADLVNREYFDRITSYANGSILTTDRLSTKKYNTNNYYSIQHNGGDAYTFGLIPKVKDTSKEEDYKVETPLLLSVTMSRDDDLVYPNLVEAVRVSNSVGRRCKYSTVGNQPMANQNYASTQSSHEETGTKLNKYSVYSPVDIVTPIEIDADSSQSVRILPPTGFNKNNSNLYFALIGGMSIIIVSILVLKVSLEQKKRNKKANISRWK